MSKIKQWIKKGEGKTIEFKRTLPDGNNIAKTVKDTGKLMKIVYQNRPPNSGNHNQKLLQMFQGPGKIERS